MEYCCGSRFLSCFDVKFELNFPIWVLYPADGPVWPVSFGPYTLEVNPDAAPLKGRFPLIVLSHGSGGSPFLYRELAAFLASHGFIVALPEHTGNNRDDNSWSRRMENYICRPRFISQSINTLLADADLKTVVDPAAVGVVGHSMGGYAALAAAGGLPWTKDGRLVPVDVDDRIKALVLMAPAAGWFNSDASLDNVHIPILLYAAEKDKVTPPDDVSIILRRLPEPGLITYKLVENGGHYSFLTPFPAGLCSPQFLPSTDPEGFDREAFQQVLKREILEFLEKNLINC
ncbi:MAG: alpha/beta fold hydrolase [Anaerolineae bacterium]|nr:alpha/beta fold hydrolase [Anaerolineae bacterium]